MEPGFVAALAVQLPPDCRWRVAIDPDSWWTGERILQAALLNDPDDCFDPESGELQLGDIVINLDRVYEQAAAYGHSVVREYAFLLVHSVLHLCGYDHMESEEAKQMEAEQERILQTLGITRD